MIVNESTDDAFAVLRVDDDADIDIRTIARLIAEPLELSYGELIQVLPSRSGLFAENLTEHDAIKCAAWVVEGGVKVKVIPQSAIVDPPDFVILRSGAPGDDVFFYIADDQQGVAKWSEILWIDFVTILEQVMEGVNDIRPMDDDEGSTPRLYQSPRTITRTSTYVDLVVYEPWMVLRIPQVTFDFTRSSLPILPARRQNLIELASTIASRATTARLGPGMKWCESGTPPRDYRVPSPAVYQGFLRWQMTRLFLQS
jgi:hypothetical protein